MSIIKRYIPKLDLIYFDTPFNELIYEFKKAVVYTRLDLVSKIDSKVNITCPKLNNLCCYVTTSIKKINPLFKYNIVLLKKNFNFSKFIKEYKHKKYYILPYAYHSFICII